MDLKSRAHSNTVDDAALNRRHALSVAGRKRKESEDFTEKVVAILREHFDASGLTQDDVVKRSGLKQSTVSRYIGKKRNPVAKLTEPKTSILLPLAHALGLTLAQAIGEETPPPVKLRKRDQQIVSAYHHNKTLRALIDRFIPEDE